MKTGLGLYRKYRTLFAYLNLLRFTLRKVFIGFDTANLFLQRQDKDSLLIILKHNGAQIGENCDIDTGLIFHNCNNYHNLSIGKNCHIGKNCFFDLRDKIIIKNNVVISMQCTFITHIDMTKSGLSKIYPSRAKEIFIDNDCYIGANATILMGVELGKQCLVASNSLIDKKIDANCLVAGIPGKIIRKINLYE